MYCLVGPSCEESEGVRVGEGESVTAQEESMDVTSQTKDEQLVRGRRKGGREGEGREERKGERRWCYLWTVSPASGA